MARSGGTRTLPPQIWPCYGFSIFLTGSHSLLDIAERAELPFAIVRRPQNASGAGLLTSEKLGADDVIEADGQGRSSRHGPKHTCALNHSTV